MATTPRKSRSKSGTRKGGATGGRTGRSGTPVLTAVEGGAGQSAAPADTPEVAPGPAPASLRPAPGSDAPPVEAPAAAPAEAPAEMGPGESEAPLLAKRDLFARVTAATGAKKKDVKLIAEATLAIIGQALSDGEELNLPPLGKVRIVKSRDAGAAEVVTLKLRRKHGLGDAPVPGSGAGGDEE